MSTLKSEIISFDIPTSGSTLDVVASSGFGVVKGAIFFTTLSTSYDTVQSDIGQCVGFFSSSSSIIPMHSMSANDGSNAVGSTCDRINVSENYLLINIPGNQSTYDCKLQLNSEITDGIRFDIVTNPSTTRKCSAIFLGGDAILNCVASGTVQSTVNTINLQFIPSICFVNMSTGTITESSSASQWCSTSFGAWINDGLQTQFNSTFVARYSTTTDNAYKRFSDSKVSSIVNSSGSLSSEASVAEFYISDLFQGINFTNTVDNNFGFFYLAIELESDKNFALQEFTGPTATGINSFNFSGIYPEFALFCDSGATASNTIQTGATRSFNFFNSSDSLNLAASIQHGSTSLNANQRIGTGFYSLDSTGTTSYAGTASFASGSVDVNFTTVPATGTKMFGLVIGGDPPPPINAAPLPTIDHPIAVAEICFDTAISASGTENISYGPTPLGERWWPCIDKINFLPTKLPEFGGIGYFAEMEMFCREFNFPSGGTYFARLIANNPYYLNRCVSLWDGMYDPSTTFDINNLTKRTYFLKNIIGPDEKGKVTIRCGDAASILNESLIPKAESSYLTAALSSGATTLSCDDPSVHTAISGVYYFAINNEIISATTNTGTGFSGLTRALGGTTASDHDIDDPIRSIFYYSGNCINAARFAIENFSDLDHATFIDDAAWDLERDTYLSSANVEIWQIEPIKVSELVNKIGSQVYAAFWWQDDEQLFKVKALGPDFSSPLTITDEKDILLGKPLKIKRDQRKIITRLWIHYGKIDKAGDNDIKNYSESLLRINPTAEAGLGTDLTIVIYADYLPASASGTVSVTASRIMDQGTEPTEVQLTLDSLQTNFKVGQFVDLQTDRIQTTTGAIATKRMRVIATTPTENNQYTVLMTHSGQDISIKYSVILPDYTLATTLSGSSETSVVVSHVIPTDTPTTGTIRVKNDAGTFIDCSYTSYSGSTYTISSTDFSINNATSGNTIIIDYLNQGATNKYKYGFIADNVDNLMSDDTVPTSIL